MDFSWAATAIETGAGFNRTLGVACDELARDRAVLHLPDDPTLHNHVGGPHAGAIFSLGESAAAVVTIMVFADLLGDHVPLIKGAEIDFEGLLLGTAYAEAVFAGDEAGARGSLAERDRATFPVEVTFRDAAGRRTGRMTARMALKRRT